MHIVSNTCGLLPLLWSFGAVKTKIIFNQLVGIKILLALFYSIRERDHDQENPGVAGNMQ